MSILKNTINHLLPVNILKLIPSLYTFVIYKNLSNIVILFPNDKTLSRIILLASSINKKHNTKNYNFSFHTNYYKQFFKL